MSQNYKINYSAPEVDADTQTNLTITTKYKGLVAETKTIPITIKKKQEQVTQPDSNGEIATNLAEFNCLVKQYDDGNYYPTLKANSNVANTTTYTCEFVAQLGGGFSGDITNSGDATIGPVSKDAYIKVPTVSYSNPFTITKATLTKK